MKRSARKIYNITIGCGIDSPVLQRAMQRCLPAWAYPRIRTTIAMMPVSRPLCVPDGGQRLRQSLLPNSGALVCGSRREGRGHMR